MLLRSEAIFQWALSSTEATRFWARVPTAERLTTIQLRTPRLWRCELLVRHLADGGCTTAQWLSPLNRVQCVPVPWSMHDYNV